MKISKQKAAAELGRRSLCYFAGTTAPELSLTPFHLRYYAALDAFARGLVRRLIVTLPPQHGKSTGSSRLLPAFLLGLDPAKQIALASYNLALAARFSRQVQRLIASTAYRQTFPGTRLPEPEECRKGWSRTAERFDVAGSGGGLLAAGREGALTGNPVDVFILDDLYKNGLEANSPLIRDNVWEWYNSVVKTRLHNASQELIVFTRWHEDDLIGRIAQNETVRTAATPEEIAATAPDEWVRLNFEAIKTGPPTPLDPRAPGEALWPERHSAELLATKRKLDPVIFETLYQGNPATREGLLYGDKFGVYTQLPQETMRSGNYTDTADTGEDYLCSICYVTDKEGIIYITDLLYTPEPMERTETEVALMLRRNGIGTARIESNNGGRGFARAVGRLAPEVRVEWFHQSRNKEARILSNSATVGRLIRMPAHWRTRWPDFCHDIITYRRLYRANRRHDGPDVLTGIVETETETAHGKKLRAVGFIK